jgi:serine/threonine protein kinase
VVAYELLTGQPPFSGASDVTIYRPHKQTQPQPPSALLPHLQHEIDEVLLKTLAKDPSNRYPNCASFSRALRQAVEIAEQKRFTSLMEEARQIKPDDDEIARLFEQTQKITLAARNYYEATDLLENARKEALELRKETPNYPDQQHLLAELAPKPEFIKILLYKILENLNKTRLLSSFKELSESW